MNSLLLESSLQALLIMQNFTMSFDGAVLDIVSTTREFTEYIIFLNRNIKIPVDDTELFCRH